ncbi:glycosyltransferase, partial [Pseudoalteromonas sp.]|uniref:glycosyltransferase n=1 Tax=Pseudoalteromonas sp. TaxID=53249 RepID=UPI003569610B
GPLVTSVGRLTEQKVLLLCQQQGTELTIDVVCRIIKAFDGRFIMLGSGDSRLERIFVQAMARHDNFLFLQGYAQALGDAMYQLGDLFLMPSSFEPCGISQMLAMRAGQPCLVHHVGGLKDTVEHQVNGFSFAGDTLHAQASALTNCLRDTLILKQQQPREWQTIKTQASNARFTWSQVVTDYINYLYK